MLNNLFPINTLKVFFDKDKFQKLLKKNLIEYLFIFAVALAFCLRIINAWKYNPLNYLHSDMLRHWSNATQPLNSSPVTALDPIVYQVWLGGIAKITIGDHFLMNIYSVLLSCITPVIWFLFFRKILPKNYAKWGFLLILFLPSWINVFSYFLVETLLIPLLGLAFYATYKNLEEKSMISFLWSVFFWLLAFFTKPIAVSFAVICLIYQIYKQNQKLFKSAICLGIFSFCLLINGFRIYKVTNIFAPFGFPHIHSTYMKSGAKEMTYRMKFLDGSTSFWLVGNPSLYGEPFKPLTNWKPEYKYSPTFNIDFSKGDFDWKQVSDLTEVKGLKSLQIRMNNFLFFFFGMSWPDSHIQRPWEFVNMYMRFLWFPMFLFCLIFNIKYLFQNKNLPLFITLNILTWIICSTSLEVGESRYHKPIEGLLIANVLWLISVFMASKNQSVSTQDQSS